MDIPSPLANVAWNACCPRCRNPYRGRAYDGDEWGPTDPTTHPLAMKALECRVLFCEKTFHLVDVVEWEREDGVLPDHPLRVQRHGVEVPLNYRRWVAPPWWGRPYTAQDSIDAWHHEARERRLRERSPWLEES